MKANHRNRNRGAVRIEEGSGNVFRDIGVKNPEEALMKAKLAGVIARLIGQLGMTQAAAAAKLGIDQPKVSILMRGQLRDFSVERLIRIVMALEQDITITIRPRRESAVEGRLRVEVAA